MHNIQYKRIMFRQRTLKHSYCSVHIQNIKAPKMFLWVQCKFFSHTIPAAPVRRRDRSLPASSFHSSVLPGQYTRRRASEKTKKTKGIDLMSHSVSKERAGKHLSHLWEENKERFLLGENLFYFVYIILFYI